MNKFSSFRAGLAAVGLVLLSACGGGGAGTDTPVVPDPPRVSQQVVLSSISIKQDDLLVQTASSSTKFSALIDSVKRYFFDNLLPTGTAYANGETQIIPGENFGFTSKVVDGKLVSLSVQLQGVGGEPPLCGDGTAEVRVHNVWPVSVDKGHLLANITVPTTINPDCTVAYSPTPVTYVILPDGSVMDTSIDGDSIVDVVGAQETGRNLSGSALVIYTSGLVRKFNILPDDSVEVQQLNDAALPLRLMKAPLPSNATNAQVFEYERSQQANIGAIAFDGRYLVGMSAERKDAVFVFDTQTENTKFVFVKSGDRFSNYGADAVYLNDEGEFIWTNGWGEYSRKINPAAGTYTLWEPTLPGSDVGSKMIGKPMYGFRGRFGKWVLSDRCAAWNYQTGDFQDIAGGLAVNTNPDDLGIPWANAIHSRVYGDVAACASAKGNIFTRVNFNTGQMTTFNTDALGFFFSAARTFQVTSKRAILSDAVDTSGSIRMMELNFETGQVVDLGVVATGNRQVTALVPVGG